MCTEFHNHSYSNLEDINPKSEVLEIFKLILEMNFTITLDFVFFFGSCQNYYLERLHLDLEYRVLKVFSLVLLYPLQMAWQFLSKSSFVFMDSICCFTKTSPISSIQKSGTAKKQE